MPTNNKWIFENEAYENGFERVCGIDEAGRGPLAGPVFAAAVVLPQGIEIEGLDDSKKLSAKKRETLYDEIIAKAVDYEIAFATEQEIDRLNILNATFLAMKRAAAGLEERPDLALVDGNRDPDLPLETVTIVKGDAKSASIAAASILAKVSRDRFMQKMGEMYPQYLFEKHKGYPTREHYDKILQYGPCEIHRKTFLKTLSKHER